MTAKNTDDNPMNPRSGCKKKRFITTDLSGEMFRIVYLLIDTIKSSEHKTGVHVNDGNSPHQSGYIGADGLIWQIIEGPSHIEVGLKVLVLGLVPQLQQGLDQSFFEFQSALIHLKKSLKKSLSMIFDMFLLELQ